MAKPKDQKPAANWKEIFIAELIKAPNVTAAARKAKIHRPHAYAEKARDAEFAEAWESALESAIEDAEGEMWRRGVQGTLKPVFHQGQKCGSIREYSDTLLIFALKAHRPEKYRETVRNEHSGPGGGPIEAVDTTLNDEQRATRIIAILDAARNRRDRQAAEAGSDDMATAAGATD